MQDCFMNTYHRLPVTFSKGKGVYLFDTAGKKYLDFTSGIAVNCLGHNHPALLAAIKNQSEKLLHVSNYYQCDTSLLFAEKLVKAAGMYRIDGERQHVSGKVFLCNSGAEANEGACKIARKYSLKKYGEGRHTIVALAGSFHGRTITTLSATGQDRFHKDFGPFTEGFCFTPHGDIDDLDRALDKKTVAAFILEAIQGESGGAPQSGEYIKAAAHFCKERDILLMFDEVQCGLGRTGAFLACQHYGVTPDVVTLAKGIAGGIPMGAVLAGEKAADVLQTGDHGSTFGGNPLACACGIAVLDIVANDKFLAGITELGNYFMEALKKLNNKKIKIQDNGIRGKGLMLMCDITVPAWSVLEQCLKNNLLLLSAGEKTLRFLPPYIITKNEIDEGLQILDSVLNKS
ncbi:MAG: acetylornithine transaminase [Termitinemataceae bacterium]|nr:MAG: acetylornithine transaminase [Termitinemataceae bacterium]